MEKIDLDTQSKDVIVNVANAGNFGIFYNALRASDVLATYKGMGPFTVFAPTDAAFAKLPAGRIESLLKNKTELNAMINLHVIRGALLAKDLKDSESESVQGAMLTIAANDDDGFTVNGAKVSRQEIEASNGIVYGIDTVMTVKH